MIIIFLLVLFLLAFGMCVRVAVRGDEDAERAEGDVEEQWFLDPVAAPSASQHA